MKALIVRSAELLHACD